MKWVAAFWVSVAINVILGVLVFLKNSSSSFLAQAQLQKSRTHEQEHEALKRLRVLLNDFFKEQFIESFKTAQNGLLFDNEIKDLAEMLSGIMRRVKDEAGRCAKPIRAKIDQLDAQGNTAIQAIVEMKRQGLLLDKETMKKTCQELETSFSEIISAIETTLRT